MHLQSLTLKGFKSFASATTLRFETGITAVVGPNGSGKSNVVDALAWVMGEQGAKTLRGGKMEDVIFAGTSVRAPLGRAEVALTIDNSDGRLPIEYAEVTVARLMFRSGQSEYTINGQPARLLDVAELLADSGIGREMHVIVSQNQLDSILSASPLDRRGFVEEAAGVLKHRKRKERALRKLEAMAANLARLTDLTAELRRQLKPLGRQAEIARKAATYQADQRDARARLLADDLVVLRQALSADVADQSALQRQRDAVGEALAAVTARESELEQLVGDASPVAAATQERWYALVSLRDRLQAVGELAGQQVRLLSVDVALPLPSDDPDDLERTAATLEADESQMRVETAQARRELDQAVRTRETAEEAQAEEDRRITSALRAAADRREGLARMAGQVAAHQGAIAASEADVARAEEAVEQARQHLARVRAEFTMVESRVVGLDAGEEGLDAAYEAVQARVEEVSARVDALRGQQRTSEAELAAWQARREALELGLARKDGASAVLAAGDRLGGVLGAVASVLTVRTGYERAVAVALGAVADGVAVRELGDALAVLELLRSSGDGRAALLVAAGGGEPDLPGRDALGRDAAPAGTSWVRDLVEAPDLLRVTVDRLLAGAVVTDDLALAATALVEPRVRRVVTTDGDLLEAGLVVGGSASTPSALEVVAAVEEAADRVRRSTARLEELHEVLAAAHEEARAARGEAAAALDRLHESDARLAAVAEELGRLRTELTGAEQEVARAEKAAATANSTARAGRRALEELEARLAAAEGAGSPTGGAGSDRRAELAEESSVARRAETEARLVLRTAEERLRALAGRAESLRRTAAATRQALTAALARGEQRSHAIQVAEMVAHAASVALVALGSSIARAGADRDAAAAARTVYEGELLAVRTRARELTTQMEELTGSLHRDELVRAEQRARLESLEARALEELGLGADVLVAEYGPDQPVLDTAGDDVPVSADGQSDPGPVRARPYVRAEQEARLRVAERALSQLGKVNPLALEEYSALEERHRYLTGQLADLQASRRDLFEIVREVDERVQQVFAAAFADTAREFEQVFARLFPGGEGRLVLTDPADLLTTGIEVEARPPGKKVKRLSLLSGGERALVAVALLVAIFKARPSPFYVLDEVEAALDDTNLTRLLELLVELSGTSQLIIITHHKRTMEIADALYGVSMRGDGVSTVISQRLRESAPA
ncbi:MAG: chromosome segregation protein SMC [Actinomycetes bacterium]